MIGSAAVDVTSRAQDSGSPLTTQSTVPGDVSLTLGGVGRNVAEAAHKLLSSTSSDLSQTTVLVSPVGDDAFGRLLVNQTQKLGMRTDGITEIKDEHSAVCNMVLDNSGNLAGGIADMDIIQSFEGRAVSFKTNRFMFKVLIDGTGNRSSAEVSA